MPYTDRHGRPELLMHPDIARGVASYRREAPLEEPAEGTSAKPASKGDPAERRPERAAG
ncbi:hypothetical protein SAMN05661080_04123 [Modestobacter sp. DSM 44400]|uniref:hypothetical protein n=1 Tax=Modestobacter sp. DSM 44400 TaxID=1550230 RepID=UPI00089D6F52|nr:hypothetical protein [Modestobacter sp. DSM 44400]SDY63739.1 hypothetical protein SAMN05661080_04123 [Modestobacter sp. DSM 44400]